MCEEKLRGCGRPSRAFQEKTGKGTSYQADAKAEPFLEGNGACDLTMDSCLVWQGQGEGWRECQSQWLLHPVSTHSSQSALKYCSITVEDIENLRTTKPKTMSLDV